jgi:hypothetical protein
VIKRVVGLLLALGCLPAEAQLSGAAPVVVNNPSTATVTYPGIQGTGTGSVTAVASPSSGGLTMTDTIAFLGPGAIPATGSAARLVPWPVVGRVIAGAVAGCVINIWCAVGAGTIAWAGGQFLDRYRVRAPGGTASDDDCSAGICFDPGQAPVSGAEYGAGQTFTPAASPFGGGLADAMAACQTAYSAPCIESAIYVPAGSSTTSLGVSQCGSRAGPGYCDQIRATGKTNPNSQPNYYIYQAAWASGVATAPSQCPGYIDPLLASANVPAGSPLGFDGKCPTGRYSQSNEEAIAQMIADHTPAVTQGIQEAYQAFNDWAHSGLPCPGCTAVPAQLSGPASVTTPEVVVTTVDGAGTSVSTSVDEYPMVYGSSAGNLGTNPATIQWPAKTTTKTTVSTPSSGAASGVPSTSTTTTTVQTGSQAEADKAAAVTQCDKFPDTLGCAALGSPPIDGPTVSDRNVVLGTVDVSSVASCPPDFTGTVRGWPIRLSYAPACEVAPTIRVGVLLLATITAIFIVVLTVSRS